jgi:putative copper export protein
LTTACAALSSESRLGCGALASTCCPTRPGYRGWLSLHVLAAAVWVGGQITVAGLFPVTRQLGRDAPRRVASAFARLSWPAYALLLAMGIWNVAAVAGAQSATWKVVLGVKIAVVLLAGFAAALHSRSRTWKAVAIWGAVTGLSSLAALVMGVFLAG